MTVWKEESVKRQVSTEDRRYIEVVLTEKGASLEKTGLDTIDQANLDILASIPEEEQQILKKNLRLLADWKRIKNFSHYKTRCKTYI